MSEQRKRVSKEIVCGVYSITNKINGKKYIGSSKDIYRRWLDHTNLLNKGKHENNYLQKSWNKYGQQNFEFEILERCDLEERFDVEQKWYDYYQTYDRDKGYNLSRIAKSSAVSFTEEDIKNGKSVMSYSQYKMLIDLLVNTDIPLNKVAEMTGILKSTVMNIYCRVEYVELTKDLNFIKRVNASMRKLNEEQVKIIIERLINREYPSDIAQEYMVSVNTINDIAYHRTWKELTKDIIFPKLNKRYNKPTKGGVYQYNLNGKLLNIYRTLEEAEELTGIGFEMIASVCRGANKTAGGFVWRYKGDSFDKYRTESNLNWGTKVNQYNSETKEYIKTYNSIKEAERILKIKGISQVLNKNDLTLGGFYWTTYDKQL